MACAKKEQKLRPCQDDYQDHRHMNNATVVQLLYIFLVLVLLLSLMSAFRKYISSWNILDSFSAIYSVCGMSFAPDKPYL